MIIHEIFFSIEHHKMIFIIIRFEDELEKLIRQEEVPSSSSSIIANNVVTHSNTSQSKNISKQIEFLKTQVTNER